MNKSTGKNLLGLTVTALIQEYEDEGSMYIKVLDTDLDHVLQGKVIWKPQTKNL